MSDLVRKRQRKDHNSHFEFYTQWTFVPQSELLLHRCCVQWVRRRNLAAALLSKFSQEALCLMKDCVHAVENDSADEWIGVA